MKPQEKYRSPLRIPQGKIGEFAVQHEAYPTGHEFTTTHNIRNVMLGGQKTVKVSWPEPVTIHRLVGPSGTWMTDLPVEVAQMREAVKGLRGRVLVGGLGLGLVASLLAQKKTVRNIVVVEKNTEVLDLVARHVAHPKIECRRNDLFDELRHVPEWHFDYAFFDIWQSDSESTFHKIVIPLYEASKGKIKHPPVNWQEGVMRAQLLWSLRSRLLFSRMREIKIEPGEPPTIQNLKEELNKLGQPDPAEPQGNVWHDRFVPFYRWHWEFRPDSDTAEYAVQFYCARYGTWFFEQEWKSFTESLARIHGKPSKANEP